MKKTLWLTYAWTDNEDADVDFVVTKLESHGIEVRLDRNRIVAGKRLWQQIDRNILASDLDGFAIYATEKSLRSEPCQEELAIALDRVLRLKGSDFPLIGIFPQPVDRELVPSSIATRLFVSLKDEAWSSRVVSALSSQNGQRIADVPAYYFKEHRVAERYIYEMRPRDGIWHPAIAMVPLNELPYCGLPFIWAKGDPTHRPAAFHYASIPETAGPDGSLWAGFQVNDQLDNTKSVYLPAKEKLSSLCFGSPRKQFFLDID